MPGGVFSRKMSQIGDAPWFFDGDPHVDKISEFAEADRGVVCEGMHGPTVSPSARIFECLRQVPVVQCGHYLDAFLLQSFHQFPVIDDRFIVHLAYPLGYDARPRQ